MTLFDRVLVNLHRGYEKTRRGAEIFSERAMVEINIVRFRIKMDSIQAEIDDLHRTIGKRMVELKDKEELPKSFDLFLKSDEIAHALEELDKMKKELDDVYAELSNEQAVLKPLPEEKEKAL